MTATVTTAVRPSLNYQTNASSGKYKFDRGKTFHEAVVSFFPSSSSFQSFSLVSYRFSNAKLNTLANGIVISLPNVLTMLFIRGKTCSCVRKRINSRVLPSFWLRAIISKMYLDSKSYSL